MLYVSCSYLMCCCLKCHFLLVNVQCRPKSPVSSWTLTISGLAGAIRSKLIDPFTYLHTYIHSYVHTYVRTYITLNYITLHSSTIAIATSISICITIAITLQYHTYIHYIHPSIHAGRMTIIHTCVDIHGNSTQEKRLRGFETSHEWSLIHVYIYSPLTTDQNHYCCILLHWYSQIVCKSTQKQNKPIYICMYI